MITGERLAEQAIKGGYLGKPYSEMDCQGFVERVIYDLGIRKPNGTAYNWRGSNSMYRNYFQWRGTKSECEKAFGRIPQGALVFKCRNDGGEKEKGYTDGLGNFYHVGMYVGSEQGNIINSTAGGVQFAKSMNGWSHVSLLSFIDYTGATVPGTGTKNRMLSLVKDMKKLIDEMEAVINEI